MIDALELAGAFVLGFIIAAVFAAFVLRHLIDLHREERKIGLGEAENWRGERRELLNRIQHPERMPVATARPGPNPEITARLAEQRRELANVGRVVLSNGDPDMELP